MEDMAALRLAMAPAHATSLERHWRVPARRDQWHPVHEEGASWAAPYLCLAKTGYRYVAKPMASAVTTTSTPEV